MTRGDWAVLALAVALVAGLYQQLWFARGAGQQVAVWLDGETVAMLPLDQDRRLRVSGPLGASVVEVRGRRVRFLASPCPRQTCVHGGWLAQAGESIACLPNHVSVQVLGGDRRYDAINF